MTLETKLVPNEYAAYVRLANAVITLAAREYADAVCSYDERQMVALESFFHSEWFSALTDLDGDYLIHRIRKCGIKGMSERQKLHLPKNEHACKRCGRIRRIHARGLCSGCYSVAKQKDLLSNYAKTRKGV